jgi:glycosyltransferase involved in cell wall biosynthesis
MSRRWCIVDEELLPMNALDMNDLVGSREITGTMEESRKADTLSPLVTIITPSYNQGNFIEETIQSVLSQEYPNIEYIVVDGGSTDNTLEILRKYSDRLRWISEPDRGQSHAINKGFQMARGEIVGWLNSDDIYLPGAIGKVVSSFNSNPEIMMVYGEGNIIDETGRVKRRFPHTEKQYDLWKLIYCSDYILQQTTFFRRCIFDTIPMLDEALCFGMDWDLFIRIGKRFPVGYIPEFLGSVREYSETKTSSGGRERFRELVMIMRRHGYAQYPIAYLNYLRSSINAEWLDAGPVRIILTPLSRFFRLIWLNRITQELSEDGWIGKRAFFVLPNYSPGKPAGNILVNGEIPASNVPLKITVDVNRHVRMEKVLEKEGKFLWTIPLPQELASRDSFHLSFTTRRTILPRRNNNQTNKRTSGFRLVSIDRS